MPGMTAYLKPKSQLYRLRLEPLRQPRVIQQMRRRSVIGKPKPLSSWLSRLLIPLEALISLVKNEVIDPD
jgi:hypothetical protein